MIILETQRFARFSDADGNSVTLSLLLDKDPGTEQPGWFIAKEVTNKVFSGPCAIDVSKLRICTTHLAQQKRDSISSPIASHVIAWVPLLNDKNEVVQHLHLYNNYIDEKSKPTTFRIKTKTDKGYEQYSL
jgi:hypothetical protein